MAGFLHGYLKEEEYLEDCAEYGAFIAGRIVEVVGAEFPLEEESSEGEDTRIGDDH